MATRAEREAAGLHGTASPVQCAECAELRRAQRAAVDGGDRALAVAATVAVRRHVRDAHHFPKGAAW
ncbi:hypothetical protein ABZ442_02925 [Streptomyces triculaminicus]|uniref:hypothetical protein n=1 Tax=Streptomyces triculaminicus TaxID=2816232 RepID=UPI003402DB0B